jgi:maltose alpha-D-glucosyltransferase/alpha-amylase
MQLYDRGIRRRLAPMLGGNPKRLSLAFSLLFSLPGTPMMQYGDEIGMGDNLRLPERECARTPMQWTSEKQGGFSTAGKLVRPIIDDPVYGYKDVNVADQRNDPDSPLNRTERLIRTRRECPEISWGNFEVLRTSAPEVLAMRYDWRGTSIVTLHNFSSQARAAKFTAGCEDDDVLMDLTGTRNSRCLPDGSHRVRLEGYGWRWFRAGGIDDTLARLTLTLEDGEVS